ncbi:MAG: lamin tail domain-containing protein [Verrucomicrobiia bacterium]
MKKTFVFVFILVLTGVVQPALAGSPVIISEFMAFNKRIITDEDGDYSDWIELFNCGGTNVNLAGWCLTDDPAMLNKWRFPDVVIKPGEYLLVFASGKNRTNDPKHLHTNFQLAETGEFLALVMPDGATIADSFSPAYPPQKEDVSYGVPQIINTSQMLSKTVPLILVPRTAAEWQSDWYAPEAMLNSNWFTGLVIPAIGFDTNSGAASIINLASRGTVIQSTTFNMQYASLAIDGDTNTYSQTLATDQEPFWQLTLTNETIIYRIVLKNRPVLRSRLRDIIVEIVAADGVTTNFVSPLLNPENQGYTYPDGPEKLEVYIAGLSGGAVPGKIIRVKRIPDTDLSGTGGQGTSEESASLALAEVEVYGIPPAQEVNLARTGNPLPTATQSSTYNNNSTYAASAAIDGNTGNFTHTASTDTNATWTLNLNRRALITSITMYNRTSCCQSRLRDIIVQVLDQDGVTVLYTSPLLNPENAGYVYPNGPMTLTIDLSGSPVFGQYIRIRRIPDPDLSGSGGQGNVDEPNVLSLAEVVVMGMDVTSYQPYIRTDLQSKMFGVNASAFVRLPFVVTDVDSINALTLKVRYNDGFIAYLNGVKIAERNAPSIPDWNSTATQIRDFASTFTPELINISDAIPLLLNGTNLLAFQILNSSSNDSTLLLQPELLASRVLTTNYAWFVEATPGLINDSEYYFGEVADTKFSVDRGFFENPFTLEITTATPGAKIYYSFDCSEPGPDTGILYTGPILITNTTVVRARAFRPGYKPTNIDTHTYIFLADVIYQAAGWDATTNNVPPPYFPVSWGRNRVDYGMDPVVVAKYPLAKWKEALTQIPTMSIVTDMKNLFDPTIGIYANADGHGILWERPASIELLDPTNSVPGRFQAPCGLRIRGGYSRDASFVKHSLRVFFRREYGLGRLHYPLFENEGANEFDGFDLRTSQNYAWPRETSYSNGRHDTMVREVFCRETLGAMGQPYRRSRYYHLYLNGQYWGLYETDERPEASYGEIYFGGKKEDYDVVKCANHIGNFVTEVTDGNFTAWSNLWSMCLSMLDNPSNSNYFRILGCNPDGTRNPALPVMLDVDNLIDYMLGIFYSGDGDATLSAFLSNTRPNNWFGMRNRNNPDMGFIFFNSDAEHTLGAPSWQVDRTGPWMNISGSNVRNFTYSNPQYFHEELMLNPEYRIRFADHVQKHFFNGGALTYEAATNRFIRKASQITKAIWAYEARWGNRNTSRVRYTSTDWTNMINEILTTIFPTRTAVVLQQLINDGLYPTISAPIFSRYGGLVNSGFQLIISHTNSSGVIYYTLDGTDPRMVGGAVRTNAMAYSSPIVIDKTSRVKARVFSGGNWSALVEADFVIPGTTQLLITELMYHPSKSTFQEYQAGFTNADDFEFIEIYNPTDFYINLAGLKFINGISFTFTAGVLAPKQRALLVKNIAAFTFRYGETTNLIIGQYQGNLNNAGERLTLVDALGNTIIDFTYSDNWYPVTDGLGFSLCLINDSVLPSELSSKNVWKISSNYNGNPGLVNPISPLFPYVVINELITRPLPGEKQMVELANLSDFTADISGWWLSDSFDNPQKYRFPNNTIIPPGGFLVITEDEFNSPALGTNAFKFSPSGGEIRLFSADSNGQFTGYYQGWDFGGSEIGVSFGRYVNSIGGDQFVAQIAPSFGSNNLGPAISPIVITEVMYHPADLPDGDNTIDEFIELYNASTNSIQLFDPLAPTNTYRITAGVDFVIPENITLAPGEFLLIVNFDPISDQYSLQRFKQLYGVPDGTKIVGPYKGKLSNAGEAIVLRKPILYDIGVPDWIQVDKVNYADSAPWPVGADGFGLSLQRVDSGLYGNDPASWIALEPSAGRPQAPVGTRPVITEQPRGSIVGMGWRVTLSVSATGSEPLKYQWRLNKSAIAGATNAVLQIDSVDYSHSGSYDVLVYNSAGSEISVPATVVVVPLPIIVQQPQPVSVRIQPDPLAAPSTNVTFSVVASSQYTLSYQWRFNGMDIPGATDSTLTITNVQIENYGDYSVRVSDMYGSVVSQSARLTPLIRPIFTIPPITQSMPSNSTVIVSGVWIGWPPPFTTEWRRSSVVLASNVQNETFSFFEMPVKASGSYRLIVKNEASPSGVAANFSITAIADSDGDGIPDVWENAYGLNPNSADDAFTDSDGDGVSNLQEYIAGTDPNDPNSKPMIETINVNKNNVYLTFTAISNRTYSIEYLDKFGASTWQKLLDIPAKTNTEVKLLLIPMTNSGGFYRLITPRKSQ